MHALEWIEQEGRYRRQIGANELRRVLNRQRRECTWCGQAVSGSRRSWCSKECVEAFMVRTPAGAASEVLKRDRGICFNCGRDCLKMESLLQLRWRSPRANRGNGVFQEWMAVEEMLRGHWRSLGFDCRHWTRLWQADHIVPVCRGGGLCDPSGYRTLCIPCHKAESAWLARERAAGVA